MDILDGVRVADFSHAIAGPAAAMTLADLGAEVVKFEPLGGELSRTVGTGGTLYTAMNRGKRSVAVDLSAARGREVASRYVENADVVIESFRRGVMERWGLHYEAVHRTNPTVIYASVSGFAFSGPDAARRGMDLVLQAESGLMRLTGELDGPPLRVGMAVVDVFTAASLSQALLAALYRRERTGKGAHIEITLLDAALFAQIAQIGEFSRKGSEPRRTGNSATQGAPADVFQTADGFLLVVAFMPKHWQRFCEETGLTDLLTDPRFSSNELRCQNRKALTGLIEDRFRSASTEAWYRRLREANLLAGRVRTYSDILSDDCLKASGVFQNTVAPDGGSVVTTTLPYSIDGERAVSALPPPVLGHDTRALLLEWGFLDEQVQGLLADGVVQFG